MVEKWGRWIITGMPAQVLETAISDTDAQLERVNDRLKNPPENRRSELEKHAATLGEIKEALAAEKAKQNG